MPTPLRINSSVRRCLAVAFACILLMGAWASAHAQSDDDETSRAIELFNEGQDAHEAGDLERAIKLYEAALLAFDQFPEAELQRGNAYLSLGKVDEAEKAFRRAVELREDWTLALANLGGVLVRKQLYTQAEPFLIRAIKLDAQNFPAYFALTELRLATNTPSERLRELLASVTALTQKANPPVSIWVARASIENSLGDFRSAATSSAAALAIDEKNPGALANGAQAALGLDDIDRASEFVKRLRAAAGETDELKTLEVNILIEREEYDDALKVISAMKDPSKEVLTVRDRIISVRSTNVEELEARVAVDPKDLAALERLCSLYRTQAPEKALEFCRRASEVDPSSIKHVVGYASALLTAGRYADSATLLHKLMQVEPENVTIRANLATALFQLKQYKDAKIQFQWLVEKQPGIAATYYFLAVTHDQLKEYLDAMANYQQFLRVADKEDNRLEIDRVNLRLPTLQRQINSNKGRRNE